MQVDPQRYPEKDEQMRFLKTYLKTLAELRHSKPKNVENIEVERLFVTVAKFTKVCK